MKNKDIYYIIKVKYYNSGSAVERQFYEYALECYDNSPEVTYYLKDWCPNTNPEFKHYYVSLLEDLLEIKEKYQDPGFMNYVRMMATIGSIYMNNRQD